MKRKVLALIILATILLSVFCIFVGFAGEPLAPEEEALIRNFMINVMGWQNITSISLSSPDGDFTVHGKVGDGVAEAEVFYSKGVVWSYHLKKNSTLPDKSVEECLEIAKNSVKAYGELFNFSLCDLFASMVPSTFQGNTTIEKERMGLRIEATQEDFHFRWGYYRFGNYTIEGVPTVIEINMYKNGLITYFGYDDRYVASWDVNISKEQALAIARSYAEEYAQNHSRTIVSEEIRLVLSIGRGNDSNACYPCWVVRFHFDEIIPLDSHTGVWGYEVYIWADTGEIFNNSPQLTPSGDIDEHLKPKTSPYAFLLVVISLCVGAVLFGIGIYKYRKNKAFSLLPERLQRTFRKTFHR